MRQTVLCSVLACVLGFSAFADDTLNLTFAGDLMAHVKNLTMKNYDDIYRAVTPWLQDEDWSFINLETPVDAKRATSGYPLFNANRAYVEAAVRAGFDVFALANNHAIDYGVSSVQGTLDTMKALATQVPIQWSGLKDATREPIAPIVLEKKGWRIGFVSLTNLLNLTAGQGRVNQVKIWDVWSAATYPKEQQALLDQIREWSRSVDFLVIGLHDGIEYAPGPSPAQVEFYDKMMEAGADVLWGNHPHVIQKWQWKETARGPRVLLYSLGNFVSNQTQGVGPTQWSSPWAATGDGVLFRVSLHRTAAGVEVEVPEPVLLNNYRDPQLGIIVCPTEWLAEQAPEAWREYYRHRLEIQKAWVEAGKSTALTKEPLTPSKD